LKNEFKIKLISIIDLKTNNIEKALTKLLASLFTKNGYKSIKETLP